MWRQGAEGGTGRRKGERRWRGNCRFDMKGERREKNMKEERREKMQGELTF